MALASSSLRAYLDDEKNPGDIKIALSHGLLNGYHLLGRVFKLDWFQIRRFSRQRYDWCGIQLDFRGIR